MSKRYWLFKTEPSCYSITDLKNARGGADCWDGVRNYQARNLLRDEINEGDGVLVYHSNIPEPAVVGLAEVCRAGYPDQTALDPRSDHFDPEASPDRPIWYMVDIRFVAEFPGPLTRGILRDDPVLAGMEVMKKGSRLSVQPVTPEEWRRVISLAGLEKDPTA